MPDIDWKWLAIIGWLGLLGALFVNVFGARSARASYDELLTSYREVGAQADRWEAMLSESRSQNSELIGLVRFCLEGSR